MRGMLIHQHQRSVRGHRDDIGVQHLCDRRSQRVIERMPQGMIERVAGRVMIREA